MKKLLIVLFSLITCNLLVSSACAAGRDHRINHRQLNQHARITQGVKSSELTKGEAKDLRSDQKELPPEERTYKADGQLKKVERKDLNEDSKEIYEDKHNEETRN